MAKYLVVYGTKEGQTAKIADKIGQVIREHGFEPDLYDASKVPSTLSINDYCGVIIGSSIHILHWSNPAIRFAKRYKTSLDKIPSAFFSVSMTMASKKEEERAKLDPYVEDFFKKSGWHPKMTANFAGAMAYTKYGWFTKWLMQKIAKSKGEIDDVIDTSKDCEYTDWNQVSKFANEFVDQVQNNPANSAT